jgi:hypothetical protein
MRAAIDHIAQHLDGIGGIAVGKGQRVALAHLATVRHHDRLIDEGTVGGAIGAGEEAILARLLFDRFAGLLDVGPGLRRSVGIKAGLPEEVGVVIKDRRRESIGESIGLAVDLAEFKALRDHAGQVVLQLLRAHHVLKSVGAEIVGDIDQVTKDELSDIGLLAGDDIGLHPAHDLVRGDGDRLHRDVGKFLLEGGK